MAIHPENYTHNTVAELNKIQQVYISDYNGVKAELEVASEKYKSGQTATNPAFKKVERLVRRKLAILEDINALGAIIDQRDGTAAAAARATN